MLKAYYDLIILSYYKPKMSNLSQRRNTTHSRKTSPTPKEQSESSYEFKRLSTEDLLVTQALEHEGISQKKEETCFEIKPQLWNNTPSMLYDAICALVTKCDSMTLQNNL